MNRVRDQLLASACFSLDKNGGIRRRDPFDLFEHRLQSTTIAYDLLESTLIRRLITTNESLDSSHREPPRARTLFIGLNSLKPLERSRAGPHHQTVWPGTRPRLLLAPAYAFLCRRVP